MYDCQSTYTLRTYANAFEYIMKLRSPVDSGVWLSMVKWCQTLELSLSFIWSVLEML